MYKSANKVYIQSPHMDKNYSLCITHESEEVCDRFKEYCMRNMTSKFKWFLQSDCRTFKMFECWINFTERPDMQDKLLEFGQQVADKLDLSFDIV